MKQFLLFPTLLFGVLLFGTARCIAQTTAAEKPSLNLVPYPKQVEFNEGQFLIDHSGSYVLLVPQGFSDAAVAGIVAEFQQLKLPLPKVEERMDFAKSIRITAEQPAIIALKLPNMPAEDKQTEAYALSVQDKGIIAIASGDAGLYYAAQTLRQLIRANVTPTASGGSLPCMTIHDEPSLRWRCWQDDFTRGPSPKLDFLKKQLALGSEFKHNLFTYYMQNQFEYKKYPNAAPKDGALLQEELSQAVAFAKEHYLDILGNQQSFAHSTGFLSVPELAHLGEAGYILSPTEPKVYDFLNDLYSEHCPLTPFGFFNVCCDETWDLAKQKPESIELAKKIGVSGVYVQHILKVYDLLKKHNKRMMMWGDIIVKHPQELSRIPKDVIMSCWWYYEPCSIEQYEAWVKPIAESGFEFWICPGQSNWSRILPQIDTYVPNLQKFVDVGIRFGTTGMINTGWEDDGESVHGYTWHAIAWGAECAWNGGKTDYKEFNQRIGAILFGGQNNGATFAEAIDTLAELQSKHDLVFNKVFWDRDFIPRQTPAVVEKRAKPIVELAQRAIRLLETVKAEATVNAELLDSFLLGARRMELIGTRILDGLEVSQRYALAMALDLTDAAQKQKVLDELTAIAALIDKNRKQHRAIEAEFVRIWNNEAKSYALDWTTKRYDELDAWFGELQQKVQEVEKAVSEGGVETGLPDIGLISGRLGRNTAPNRVTSQTLSAQTPWKNPDALMRLGLTIEAGDVDRITFPVELDLNLPESCVDKNVEAYMIGVGNSEPKLIPAQLDSANVPQNPNRQRLTLLLPGLAKGATANVYVYFGLDEADTSFSSVSTTDGENGMKIIENDRVQIHLGPEGGHVYKWLDKYHDNLDMTDPGDSAHHGFSDHGHADRSKQFELVCMNNGPAMVRYGCFFEGELVKTLTVYADLPILDVITMTPTHYFWNFDDPDLFDADGKTPGTFLFSNGRTGPTPSKGSGLQTAEPDVFWVIKFNEQGWAHGMVTPEAPSRFVVGPGGGMGGVGIESNESRSHFVTNAWNHKNVLLPQWDMKILSSVVMEGLQRTHNLKNQPVVVQYAQEQPER